MAVKGGISKDDYKTLRLWLAELLPLTLPQLAQMSPEIHPIAVLDAMAQKSPATARKGLALAIGDIVEDTSHLPSDTQQNINDHLAGLGLPTLSSVRWRFQGRAKRIVERGKVRTDDEYYTLRNTVGGVEDEGERRKIWGMLAAYEERIAATHA